MRERQKLFSITELDATSFGDETVKRINPHAAAKQVPWGHMATMAWCQLKARLAERIDRLMHHVDYHPKDEVARTRLVELRAVVRYIKQADAYAKGMAPEAKVKLGEVFIEAYHTHAKEPKKHRLECIGCGMHEWSSRFVVSPELELVNTFICQDCQFKYAADAVVLKRRLGVVAKLLETVRESRRQASDDASD